MIEIKPDLPLISDSYAFTLTGGTSLTTGGHGSHAIIHKPIWIETEWRHIDQRINLTLPACIG
jgi:hypothetical protein